MDVTPVQHQNIIRTIIPPYPRYLHIFVEHLFGRHIFQHCVCEWDAYFSTLFSTFSYIVPPPVFLIISSKFLMMVFWAYFSLALVMCAPAGILVCYSTDLSISLQPLWLLPLPHPRTAKLCFPWNLMEVGKLRKLLIPRDTTFYWQVGHLQRPFCQKDLLHKRILKFQFGYEFMGKNAHKCPYGQGIFLWR